MNRPQKMARVWLTSSEVWPVLGIYETEHPDSVEVPKSLVSAIDAARVRLARAEGELYDWMLTNNVRPEEVREILRKHEEQRQEQRESEVRP